MVMIMIVIEKVITDYDNDNHDLDNYKKQIILMTMIMILTNKTDDADYQTYRPALRAPHHPCLDQPSPIFHLFVLI